MKIASALFTLVVISAMTHLALAEDLAQGFAGIPWGASIETVDGLQETARSENIRYYQRRGESYTIGDLMLSDVMYGFYDAQFFAAYLKVSSPEAFDALRRYLEKTYGQPRAQLRVDQTIYIWDYLDTKIKLKQPHDRMHGKLAYYYVPLSTRANQARSQNDALKVYDLDAVEPDFGY